MMKQEISGARNAGPRYLLLARHGSRMDDPDLVEWRQGLDPKKVAATREVAAALAEHLSLLPEDRRINIAELWHGAFRHTRVTASIFGEMLGREPRAGRAPIRLPDLKPTKALDPDSFWRTPSRGSHTAELAASLMKRLNGLGAEEPGPDAPNAVLVVGHQPQLSWIGGKFLRDGPPLAHSEVLCISVRDRRLLWSIAPTDDATLAALRDKIKSKMEVAKYLGSFILAILALFLDPAKMAKLPGGESAGVRPLTLQDIDWAYTSALLAAGLLVSASVLYLATLYAYDRLLMPSRFWRQQPDAWDRKRRWPVQMPPSSTTYILYQNMTHIWNSMFLPATGLVVVAAICLTYAALRPDGLIFVVAVTLCAVVLGWYCWQQRPRLGADD
jgi:hypothetical protein